MNLPIPRTLTPAERSRRAEAQTLLWRYKARSAKQAVVFARYELERLLIERAGRGVLVDARKKLASLQRVAAKLSARAKEVRVKNQRDIFKE